MPTTLTSGSVTGYNPAYGGVPSVPNPTSTAAESIAGNISNLSAIGTLGTGVTAQNNANAMSALTSALPGLSGILGTLTGNAGSLASGQIPSDVLANLQQQGAERGISTGQIGGANNNAAYLKALGLTSLGLEQTGQQDLTSLMSAIPQGTAFNAQSMMTTPQQQQSAQESANVLASSPIPGAAAGNNMNSLMQALAKGQGSTSGLTGGTGYNFGNQSQSPYQIYSSTGGRSSNVSTPTDYYSSSTDTVGDPAGGASPYEEGGDEYYFSD